MALGIAKHIAQSPRLDAQPSVTVAGDMSGANFFHQDRAIGGLDLANGGWRRTSKRWLSGEAEQGGGCERAHS